MIQAAKVVLVNYCLLPLASCLSRSAISLITDQCYSWSLIK
ncbi:MULTISPECIES: hypothetical protein [Moorena]|nr:MULTISPECIES: hypothetical protein [Moorena]